MAEHCVILSGCIESNGKSFIWSRSRRRVSRLSENCLSMGAYQPFRHCQAKSCSTIRACCRCAALFKFLEQQSQLRRLDSVTPINVIFQNVCLQKNHALQTKFLKASNLIKLWNHTVKALNTYKNTYKLTHPMPVSITQNLNHRTIRGLSMIISSSSSAWSSTYVVAGSSLAE